jgi:hypothetical protein
MIQLEDLHKDGVNSAFMNNQGEIISCGADF